ncbi:MAG: hypothetical protein JWP11_1313 [Frankiales bacterium]|nr:hypothetical protein [Frankiales bacterium]
MTAPKAASVRTPQHPVDGDHALRIGWVLGALLRAPTGDGISTHDVVPEHDGAGGFMDAIRITAPSGSYLVSIEKET